MNESVGLKQNNIALEETDSVTVIYFRRLIMDRTC
jgi:hypothetical protein